MIPLFKVYVNNQHNIQSILESGYIGQGQKVEEFEKLLKEHFNNDKLLYVNSCTSAIHLALEDIKRKANLSDDIEILSTCLSCFATVSPILSLRMNIKWVDIDEQTCNINLDDLESKLTDKTRILIFVHWGGHPVDLNRIELIKQKYKDKYNQELFVIEDCAHCWNSKFEDSLIGNSGNYCCFSFQAIKFLTTVDGGLIITPDDDSYKRIKLMRWFGLDRDKGESFRCVQNIKEFGYKFQPNDVLAEIGISNFNQSLENVKKHKANAKYLTEKLKYLGIVPKEYENSTGAFWLYTIHITDNKNIRKRDQFIQYMKDNGIACSQVHARMDTHDCVKDFKTNLPIMDKISNSMVCIPVGWWLNQDDLDYIIEKINNFIHNE